MLRSQTTAPIEFKSEFTNSPAALAANHDDTVSHILTRLDQLQASISGETPKEVAPTLTANHKPIVSRADPNDLHARLSALESVHEDTLHQLGAKLTLVEQKIRDNREAENLMGQISSKFSLIESRLQGHAKLHERVNDLESQIRPSPEDERTLARINSKLDMIEDRQRLRARQEEPPSRLGSSYREPPRRSYESRVASRFDHDDDGRMGSRFRDEESSMGRAYRTEQSSLGKSFRPEDSERAEYLRDRIERLEQLKSRYHSDEDE